MYGNTRVGQALHGEHQDALTALDDMEQMIRNKKAVNPTDPATRRSLDGIFRILDNDVARHFPFEEEHIFPILRDAGADDMADLLTSDHDIIRPLARRLCELNRTAVEAGSFSDDAWTEFRDLGRELIDRQTFHVQKEEMGMLTVLTQVLNDEQDVSLSGLYMESAH